MLVIWLISLCDTFLASQTRFVGRDAQLNKIPSSFTISVAGSTTTTSTTTASTASTTTRFTTSAPAPAVTTAIVPPVVPPAVPPAVPPVSPRLSPWLSTRLSPPGTLVGPGTLLIIIAPVFFPGTGNLRRMVPAAAGDLRRMVPAATRDCVARLVSTCNVPT
ncbi:hypothetical protein PCANC_01275 [Puccinia coronata f. sp. avenae]|uniref:Uncharacterized protein n=1 Tax=Puccinia coronata f. sp. avenae TaxID=200324 RepID=A0A2N5W3S3_9BASI|nr:hypothetical protein PCANC_01275 [Puccinia coronata f. sp. avenae]